MSIALAFLPRVWACDPLPSKSAIAKAGGKPLEPVEPRLAFYRKYTEAMLRRYMRFSMETGRVPSMLGQEMFRSKVTSYRVHSFEDLVIFVHDVEKCIGRLTQLQQTLIVRMAIQEYTHEETAVMMGTNRRTILRRYEEAIDCLTAIFLELNLLEPRKACQEGARRT